MRPKINHDLKMQGEGRCPHCNERMSKCPDFGYCNEDWKEEKNDDQI